MAKEIGENTRKHRLGSKHPPETIEKMKRSAKTRDDSKRIAVLKSDKHRDKISKATKGVKKSETWRKKMTSIRQTSEYREKMSLATKGIQKSEGMKNKASIAKLGKQIVLINEDGYKEDVVSLRDFAKKYGLNRKELSSLIKGRRTIYRGWRVSQDNAI